MTKGQLLRTRLPQALWIHLCHNYLTEQDLAAWVLQEPLTWSFLWSFPYSPRELLHCCKYKHHPLDKVATETFASYCQRLSDRARLHRLHSELAQRTARKRKRHTWSLT